MWVLESAHRYARASAVLLNAHLTYESEVNAALAMELLIKSLLVVPVENDRAGTVMQQYEIPRAQRPRDGHNLFQLYEMVPVDVAEKVGLNSQADLLEKKQNMFKQARYIYEASAPRGSDTLLLQNFFWLFPQVALHIASLGEPDKWLQYMIEKPERMSLADAV